MPGTSQSEVSTNSPKCNCLCSQLATTVQELEEKVDKIIKGQSTWTPKRPILKPCGSVQKGEQVQKGKFPETLWCKFSFIYFLTVIHSCFFSLTFGFLLDWKNYTICISARILLDFERFRLGPRADRKSRENACQARSQVHRFFNYMLVGSSATAGTQDLRFMNHMDRLHM